MQSVLETFETQFLQSNFPASDIYYCAKNSNIQNKSITKYAMKSNIIDTIN